MNLNILEGVLIGIHVIVWMWLSGEFEDEDQNQIIRRVIKRNRGS